MHLTAPCNLAYFPFFAAMKPRSLNSLTTSLPQFHSLVPLLVLIPKYWGSQGSVLGPFLFSTYPFFFTQSYKISWLNSLNNSQIFIFNPNLLFQNQISISNCLLETPIWVSNRHLKLPFQNLVLDIQSSPEASQYHWRFNSAASNENIKK